MGSGRRIFRIPSSRKGHVGAPRRSTFLASIKSHTDCKKLRRHNSFSVFDTPRMRTAAAYLVHIEIVHDQCAAANVLSRGFEPDTQPKIPPCALIMARPIS